MSLSEFGRELQDAMAEVAGRRSVPQVFVNGKHIGGSTGKFLQLSSNLLFIK